MLFVRLLVTAMRANRTSLPAFLLLLLALAAPTAQAGREFNLFLNDKPVAGEVCFYKSAPELRDLNPAGSYFHSGDVRCLPSGTGLDFPKGRFFYFGRTADGSVSPHRYMLTLDKPTEPNCSAKQRIDLLPGATLDLARLLPTLAPGEYAGVWIADTQKSVSTFLPAIPGETRLAVPSGVPLVPLLIANGRPKRIGAVLNLAAGERRELSFPSSGRTGDVVVWIDRGGPEKDRAKLTVLPRISLVTASGERREPMLPFVHPSALTSSVVFFKDVPAGASRVTLDGDFWTTDSVEVDVQAGQVAVASRGFRPIPAGSLTVLLPDAMTARMRALLSGCGRTGAGEVAVEVVRCSGGQECVSVARKELSAEGLHEPLKIGGLAAGDYTVRLDPPETAMSADVTVAVMRDAVATPQVDGQIIRGRITKGARPVRAQIQFPTADIAISDEDGNYEAVLRADPGDLPIPIRMCSDDATAIFLPSEAPVPERRFDIELPDNQLRVTVSDASTGAPVPNARVAYVPGEQTDGNVTFALRAKTNEKGEALFRTVVSRRALSVCTMAEGYQRQCSRTFMMEPEKNESIAVALRPEGQRTGRILSSEPLAHGRVYLLDVTGAPVESAVVSDDGTFGFTTPAPAAVVVVSQSHPLFVAERLPMTSEELRVELPVTGVRNVTVGLRPESQASARIGLTIGSVIVPAAAFVQHQSLRQQQAVIVKGRPVVIRDIADVAPVSVHLGPEPDDRTLPPDAVSRPDYLASFKGVQLARDQSQVLFE